MDIAVVLFMYFGAVIIPLPYLAIKGMSGCYSKAMFVGIIIQCICIGFVWLFVYLNYKTNHTEYYWGWVLLIPVNIASALYYCTVPLWCESKIQGNYTPNKH
jgi:hypothetical protein